VEDAGDFYGVLLELIHGDIGQGRKDELAPSFHTFRSSTVGKVPQRLATFVDGFYRLAGGGRVVFLNAPEYSLQVVSSEG
jgi:hypothetical protein